METENIRLGISACLMGQKVRYDGGHKWDRFLTDTLGRYVEYVPVCPEVECGLGTPREAMRLVGNPAAPRLVTVRSGVDLTDRMRQWAAGRVAELADENLCGFIFKSDSPSSGMERVKVYSDSGMPVKTGVGLFARAFMDRFPLIPTEEEGRLHDPGLRENFIERIFTLRRWRKLLTESPTPGGLVDFHTRNKLLIRAHCERHYREMGKLVAEAGASGRTGGAGGPLAERLDRYETLLMGALSLRATHKKHVNVLQHMMGYLKKVLSADEKQELLELIDLYRRQLVPLVAPLTLLNHYIRKYDVAYLKDQTYVQPHPVELKLRNHV